MTFFNEQVAIEFLLEGHGIIMRIESPAKSAIIPVEGRMVRLNTNDNNDNEFIVEKIVHSYYENAPFQQVIQLHVVKA